MKTTIVCLAYVIFAMTEAPAEVHAQCTAGGPPDTVPGLGGGDTNFHGFSNQCLAMPGTHVEITIEALGDLGCNAWDATHDDPSLNPDFCDDCNQSCSNCCSAAGGDPTIPCCDVDPEDKYITVRLNGHSLTPSADGAVNVPPGGEFFKERTYNDCWFSDPPEDCLENGRSPCDGSPSQGEFNRHEVSISAEQWNTWLGATGNAMTVALTSTSAMRTLAAYCDDIEVGSCQGCGPCSGSCGGNTGTRITVSYSGVECTTNGDCDDGMFCNGAETCVDYECQAGPGDPCDPLGLSCDEDADQCWSDCNSNGVYDDLDIHGSTSHDCNDNDLPDECDLVAMTSGDCNTNSVPDECDVANLGGGFEDSSFWATFDPGTNEVGTDPVGYLGAVFDGRYVYFVPNYNGTVRHGEVLRYDTTGDFGTTTAWATCNPEANGVGTDPVGFVGGVFDGRFVYFAPWKNTAGAFHGEVLR